MIKSTSIFTALAIACGAAVFSAPPAEAQTAGNLKCKGCVNSKDIKNRSVRGRDIRDGSLTAVDLGDEAGVEFDDGRSKFPLSLGIDRLVGTITVTAPRSGFVILNASANVSLVGSGAVACSLTTGSTLVLGDNQQASGTSQVLPLGMTEGFAVPAGSTTFNLICRETKEAVGIFGVDLTAIYAPTRY